jgi:hypothetical protein
MSNAFVDDASFAAFDGRVEMSEPTYWPAGAGTKRMCSKANQPTPNDAIRRLATTQTNTEFIAAILHAVAAQLDVRYAAVKSL